MASVARTPAMEALSRSPAAPSPLTAVCVQRAIGGGIGGAGGDVVITGGSIKASRVPQQHRRRVQRRP
ncbi:MAG: hypothetical protein M0C28_30705 [Candidatus Moduliflexus flocculans]|nr:hypothetical protein [Candidatus Moduliflexus flocculans]